MSMAYFSTFISRVKASNLIRVEAGFGLGQPGEDLMAVHRRHGRHQEQACPRHRVAHSQARGLQAPWHSTL